VPRVLPGLLALLVAGACAAPRLPKMRSPQPCCASADDVRRLDGQRVMVDGMYRATLIGQRPGDEERRRARGERPSAAGVETEGGLIMLGVYHRPDGVRPPDELERLSGRHVIVYGRLRASTPVRRAADGTEMATMTGPYLEDIERIEVR
jgi:hypothetical protein